jgi:hypothetical protein
MRKFLSFCFFLFFFNPIILSNENEKYDKVTFGIKANVNISNLRGSIANAEYTNKIDFAGGFLWEYRLNRFFSIQPEFLYSRQGKKFKFSDNNNSIEFDLKMNYFSLPLLFNIIISEQFVISLGPQIGLLFELINDKEILDSFKRPDFSLVSGIEYRINNSFFLFGRYCYGINDIGRAPSFKKKQDEVNKVNINMNFTDHYNLLVQIGLGVKF